MADETTYTPLPADLPEDWTLDQIVAPAGADAGLSEQHGYNYLMKQVNDTQRAVNEQQEQSVTVTQEIEGIKDDITQMDTDKQDKLTGSRGQIVGFDADGNAVAQAAPATGVTSFKNRSGAVTPQSGDYSVSQVTGAAPTASPVFTGSISLGRKAGTAIGSNSFAVGNDVTASSTSSHAEGYKTTASNSRAHAEGENTTASAMSSHAEGIGTTAMQDGDHAEGIWTTANGYASHAEGNSTTTSASGAHAEGGYTTAKGVYSHAGGNFTVAGDYQTVVGTYNVEKTSDQSSGARFIVGGGSSNGRKNAFRVDASGACYGVGAWNTSGADYAELFEWADNNPSAEDRAGLFVTLDGDRLRIATPEDDYIIGVVSACPSVVGDVYDDQWAGMYVRDVFGRTVMEMQDFPAETMERPNENGEMETVEIIPARRELAPKVNPDYDHNVKYQPRTQRPEWDAVGMMGKLVAVDDGTCQVNGWAAVGQGGRATRSEARTRYRVMARLDDTHIQLLIL